MDLWPTLLLITIICQALDKVMFGDLLIHLAISHKCNTDGHEPSISKC